MKTRILTLGLLMSAALVSAQIKVLSTGQVGICTTTVPTGYSSNILGYKTQIGINDGLGHSALTIEAGGVDVRMSGNTGKVVFYGTTGFNDIQCKVLTQNSDARNKTNIVDIKDGLKTVKKLKGVSYNWKNDVDKKVKRKDFGFLAQDVELVIPDAVITADSDTTDNKMIAYSSFIPYLVEAIKELSVITDDQNKQIVALQTALSKGSNKSATITTSLTDATQPNAINAILYQNNPNPFTELTQISFYLPTSVKSAVLNIYDMQGLQIKSIAVSNRENASETISGSELKAGMYFYSLIADGQEIDTKRMILTK